MKVGIDLGTSYSLIATMYKDDNLTLLPDNQFLDIVCTPSVVSIGEQNAFVGQTAELMAEEDLSLDTQRLFKRAMGTSKPILFDRGNNPWYPESISALVLKKLSLDAEIFSNTKIEGRLLPFRLILVMHNEKLL